MTAQPLSEAEAAVVARFDAAPTPPEVLDPRVVEEVARAMADVDDVDWDSELTLRIGTRGWYLRYAAAAAAAYRRAAQDGGAEEAWAADELTRQFQEEQSGNPTEGLWGKRNTSSGHFEAIKRSGDVFKGVKREN